MANVQFLSILDCWKQHMFFFAETCYVVHFNNPMMALSKSYKGRIKCFSLTSMNETPATVEPNATASTPATVESDPTASTPTQPSTRSGRKVHLPTSEECLTTQRGRPYKVINRSDKVFTLFFKGQNVNVSIDRLKPCFSDNSSEIDIESSIGEDASNKPAEMPKKKIRFVPLPLPTSTRVTIGGRQVCLPCVVGCFPTGKGNYLHREEREVLLFVALCKGCGHIWPATMSTTDSYIEIIIPEMEGRLVGEHSSWPFHRALRISQTVANDSMGSGGSMTVCLTDNMSESRWRANGE
ncbi:uncharacterized protein TNCV_3988451 [Trichonephila clavipes]|nr:uncharacterized protein TNCV_3988451 [Trichonephila clavipes]